MPWDIEINQNAAILRMNSNPVNCQNEDFFRDFTDAFDRIEHNYPKKAVVLTSNQNAFCAGLDFEEVFQFFGTAPAEAVEEWFNRYREINLRIFTYPYPTIAAINSHAIAGGLILALTCDYRIAVANNAKLGINEVPIGIPMPSTYIEIIKYATGIASASISTLFGKLYSVEDSLRLQFIHQIVAEADLLPMAIKMANSISENAFAAYQFSKQQMQRCVLQNIRQFAIEMDKKACEIIISPECRAMRLETYEKVKGKPAPWRNIL